jgi:hypothetical protein
MQTYIRQAYNDFFTEEKYQAFLHDLNTHFDHEITFRVAETPIFIPQTFTSKLMEASESIKEVLMRPDLKEITKDAVPPKYNVPAENSHPLFIVVDFAVCKDENGELSPQMIEFQGCPSLYCYQDWVAGKYRKHFPVIPDSYNHLANQLDSATYINHLKEAILGDKKPENTILLEVDPMNQNTAIDFLCHEELIGIKAVCLTDIIKEGRKLYYMRDGVKTPIHRIYNRTIFDDLVNRSDLDPEYKLTQDVDVEWAGHPNWFFRVSKYTMPFIDSPFVPKTYFLHELEEIPQDLENYVLKPLFSFAGAGVIFDVTQADIDAIEEEEKSNYILQKKVTYAPVVQAPDGLVKCEIRMLYIWPEGHKEPMLVTNLARLSRGKLIGVKYNKDKTWVGGSICFFES